jgi:16S rRNA (cytosine1402-N4)-methyltransferase
VAVNAEFDAVDAFLPVAADLLAPGGRCCILAFHSLEDRPVKRYVRRESRDCVCDGRLPACVCGHRATLVYLTPKPIVAGDAECARNPRARSAKLRAFERAR